MSADIARDEIARVIHAQVRAMNRVLRKARLAGIRVAVRIDSAVEPNGQCWDVGTYGSVHHNEVFGIAEWATRVQAITIKRERTGQEARQNG